MIAILFLVLFMFMPHWAGASPTWIARLPKAANDNRCESDLTAPVIRWTIAEGTQLIGSNKRRRFDRIKDMALDQLKLSSIDSPTFKMMANRLAYEMISPPFALVAGSKYIQITGAPSAATVQVQIRQVTDPVSYRSFWMARDDLGALPKLGSPDGRYILTTDRVESEVRLVGLDSGTVALRLGRELEVKPNKAGQRLPFQPAAAFSADGTFLTVGRNDRIEVYDLHGAPTLVETYPIDWEAQAPRLYHRFPLASQFRGNLLYLPRFHELLVINQEKSPLQFTPATRHHPDRFPVKNPQGSESLAITDSSQLILFIVNARNHIELYSLSEGHHLRGLTTGREVSHMVLSPDDRYLAVSFLDGQDVEVFDLKRDQSTPFLQIALPVGLGSLLGFADATHLMAGDDEGSELFAFDLLNTLPN